MTAGNYYSFIALGGGNHAGGSCYALKAGDSTIILDAGVHCTADYLTSIPDVRPLYDSWRLDSLREVSALVISHSHNDHAGALQFFSREIDHKKIFSSQALPEMLCAQNNQAASVSDIITVLPYGEKYYSDGWGITLFPAGHIPGAAMTLLEADGAKILYTGDFCTFEQFSVNGAYIPDTKIDTLICETTYGYTQSPARLSLETLADKVNSLMRHTDTFTATFRNAGKESEFALALNECAGRGMIPDIDIWIDPEFSRICSAVGKWGKSDVIGGRVKVIDTFSRNIKGCIITPGAIGGEYELGFNMPNHEDCGGILHLIAHTRPDRIIFIHGIPLSGGTRNILHEVRERFGTSIEALHVSDGMEANLFRE